MRLRRLVWTVFPIFLALAGLALAIVLGILAADRTSAALALLAAGWAGVGVAGWLDISARREWDEANGE